MITRILVVDARLQTPGWGGEVLPQHKRPISKLRGDTAGAQDRKAPQEKEKLAVSWMGEGERLHYREARARTTATEVSTLNKARPHVWTLRVDEFGEDARKLPLVLHGLTLGSWPLRFQNRGFYHGITHASHGALPNVKLIWFVQKTGRR